MAKIERTIGEQIREAREHAELSQTQLAERAGVTQDAVSLVERGERDSKISTIAKLATAMGYAVALLKRS